MSNKSQKSPRLPTDVKPTHYDVTVLTDLKKLTFNGWVTIDLEVANATSSITFHSAKLNLSDVSLQTVGSHTDVKVTSVDFDTDTERATVKLSSSLQAGTKVQLKAKFDAALTGSMMGYYYSSWEKDGKTQYYTLTQFEPTAARRAFPCWDEPLLKATYAVSLISRADTVNLGNMPAISEEPYKSDDGEQWKITKFQTTPPVSSYLVAYANGYFKYIEGSYVSPLSGKTRPLRIYATEDNIHQAEFALDVKRKVLPLYEKMFEVEYPLPKLDTLIASDFDAGAMENWGLITGRTTAFLLDPKKSGVAAQKRVATVQSHEVAHMWFGNITTMAWWDNLYLNEGFATLMGEVITIDKVFPEWKVYSEFITEHWNRALDLDAKKSSHPIEVECPNEDQINQIFDDLSYSKAASVLRMLSAYVGEEKFLKGVSIYLQKHLYANSVSRDLWDGIGEATGLEISKMMTDWVSKIGYPVLTVTETPNGIKVRQDRFLETGPASDEDNQTIWHVPLNLVRVDGDGRVHRDNTLLLKERETTIPLDTSLPFKLNYDTSGAYRVLYSPERLAKISAEAAKEKSAFSLNDRIGLVHDSFALAKAGFLKMSGALNLVQNFRHEQEFLVWQGMNEKISNVATIWWEDDRVFDLLSSFRKQLYYPLVEKFGYDYDDNDSADVKQLRTLAIAGAANADEPRVVAELQKRFNEFVKTGDDSKIALDLERCTYQTVVRHGGREAYDFIKTIYAKPRTPTTRTAAIIAMCAAKDQDLIDETFRFILNEARDQDVYIFFAFLGANRVTRRQLFKFVLDHYDSIYKRFSENTQLKYLMSYPFKSLTKESDAKAIEEFFKDKDVSKFNLSLSQALETIRAQAALLERSSADVLEWLEKWEKSAESRL